MAIASTVGLVVMSALVIVLAVRGTRPSLAGSSAPPPTAELPPTASTTPSPIAGAPSAAAAPQIVRPTPSASVGAPAKKPVHR
jgi:hypothetical protein